MINNSNYDLIEEDLELIWNRMPSKTKSSANYETREITGSSGRTYVKQNVFMTKKYISA